MNSPFKVISQNNGIKLVALRGLGMVLLSYTVDDHLLPGLAGFAIQCTSPDGKRFFLQNRLRLNPLPVNQLGETPANPDESIVSPFQKMRWLHVPSTLLSGIYTYEVIPVYFAPSNRLITQPGVNISIELFNNHPTNFDWGFTRGFLQSQAYAQKFGNKPIRPKDKNAFPYTMHSYEARHIWLGGKAYKMFKDFIRDALTYDTSTLDVMVYDFDIPDVLHYLASFGNRLRIIFDTSKTHIDPTDAERKSAEILQQAGAQIRYGKLGSLQHNKVFILKDQNNKAQKVFTGSANFSIRGFFAQANNVFVIDNDAVAGLYEQYFEEMWARMSPSFGVDDKGEKMNADSSTQQWFDIGQIGMPKMKVSFAPHKKATISLQLPADAVRSAQSSVFFSIMAFGSSSLVINEIVKQQSADTIFSYGTYQTFSTDNQDNIKIVKQNEEQIVRASLLKEDLEPFKSETNADGGMMIHHKFVVVDFNTPNAVVFTGSSNLADSGEQNNGDNLLAIYDEEIATGFAIEALRLFDHYSFRYKVQQATEQKGDMSLQGPNPGQGEDFWWKPYYTPGTAKFDDRLFFTK